MALIGNNVFDQGLNYLNANASHQYICSQEPATYTEASSTYALGVKAAPSIAAPSDRTGGGREVVVAAITDGSVTATGTASHYALVNQTGTELLAANSLASSQAVTSGNPWTTGSYAIGIPDPA